MCADLATNNPFTSSAHALSVDIVAERILAYLDEYREDLMNYRLVSHKWNDIIIRKIKGTRRTFNIPLRYEPHVPQFIDASGGQQGAGEVLDTTLSTLAATKLQCDSISVIIDRDFYLAGVMSEFQKFLRIYGQSIHSLKIKIRPESSPKENENHVMDEEEVVSMGCLRALFQATPNLKSLNFCVRFSHYKDPTREDMTVGVVEQRCIYGICYPPQLQSLTRMKVKEPEGVHYSVGLFINLISLSPNLESLKIKPYKQLSNFARALRVHFLDSLTSLCISNPLIDATYSLVEMKKIMKFSYLSNLTCLTLNKIRGQEKYNWIRSVLRANRYRLTEVILGLPKLNDGVGEEWNFDLELGDVEQSLFPPVMEDLVKLEINLTEFKVREHVAVESYETQFPSLNTLKITGHEANKIWTLKDIDHMLPGVEGECETLEEFVLQGDIGNGDDKKIEFERVVSGTFPNAQVSFSLNVYRQSNPKKLVHYSDFPHLHDIF